MFETTEWSLETYDMVEGEGGRMVRRKIDLLDGEDPFKGIEVDAEEIKGPVGRGSYAPNLSG